MLRTFGIGFSWHGEDKHENSQVMAQIVNIKNQVENQEEHLWSIIEYYQKMIERYQKMYSSCWDYILQLERRIEVLQQEKS